MDAIVHAQLRGEPFRDFDRGLAEIDGVNFPVRGGEHLINHLARAAIRDEQPAPLTALAERRIFETAVTEIVDMVEQVQIQMDSVYFRIGVAIVKVADDIVVNHAFLYR